MPALGTVSNQRWALNLIGDRKVLLHNLSCRVALLHDQYAVGMNIREAEVLCLRLIYFLTLHIIYIGIRRKRIVGIDILYGCNRI